MADKSIYFIPGCEAAVRFLDFGTTGTRTLATLGKARRGDLAVPLTAGPFCTPRMTTSAATCCRWRTSGGVRIAPVNARSLPLSGRRGWIGDAKPNSASTDRPRGAGLNFPIADDPLETLRGSQAPSCHFPVSPLFVRVDSISKPFGVREDLSVEPAYDSNGRFTSTDAVGPLPAGGSGPFIGLRLDTFR